jgi:uncharacterized protein
MVWLYVTYLCTSLTLGLLARAYHSTSLTHWFQLVDALVTVAFCVRNFAELQPLLRPRVPGVRAVAEFVGASAAFLVAAKGVFWLLESAGLPFVSSAKDYVAENRAIWVIFAAVSVAPAIWEELAFRGVIQKRLGDILTRREAWIVQAALFSVLHLSPVIFLTHFGMGLMFGWLRDRYASIYPGMCLHAAWNALVVLGDLSA